jgi:hypothetical protein
MSGVADMGNSFIVEQIGKQQHNLLSGIQCALSNIGCLREAGSLRVAG